MSVRPRRPVFAVGLGVAMALVAAPLVASAAPVAPMAPASAVNLAVVVPLTVPPGRDGFLSAAELEEYTEPGGLLARELDAVSGSQAAIGIDPMIIASIRLLGSGAPDSAVEWLERLRTAENETFALAYADADITLGLQAGSSAPLEPRSFDFAIDPTLFNTNPAATPDPEQTAVPGEVPMLPSTETLLDWTYTLDSIAWPRASTTTTADLEKLAASNYSTTILNAQNLKRVPTGRAHVTVAGTTAVVTNDSLSDLLTRTVTAESAVAWEQSFEALSAGVAQVQGRSGSGAASVVLTLGRAAIDERSRLRATLTGLAAIPSVTPTSLAAILDEAPATASLAEKPHNDARVELVQAMIREERSDAAFSTVAENPEWITGDRRIRLLTVLGYPFERSSVGWSQEVADFVDDSERLRNSVRLAESSDLIFGDRGSLPINVTNNLGQAVTVVITVEPQTPLLTVEDPRFELVIEPSSQRRAAVPAVARSNGLVELEITLRTSTGEQLGATRTITTNVQAGWEGPFTIIIGLLVVGVFGFGIFRTIVRRRQARANAAQPIDDVAMASPGTE